MIAVAVTFPVLRGTSRFIVQTGRRWSVIEHLLLDAVTRAPGTALDFAEKSGLPRRVVVEAFIRLMRAGWVEIHAARPGLEFHPTALGLVQAPLDQLPAATVTQPKKRSFAIEQITGGVFRSRELDLRPSYRLPHPTEDQLVIHLPGSLIPSQGDLTEVFTAIEGEDELIVGIDRSAERLLERHAVVMVRDGVIEGLPGRASPTLRNLILARAAEAVSTTQHSKQPKPASPSVVVGEVAAPVSVAELAEPTQALYEGEDLILDGAAHKAALERMLRQARQRVIIHSTFVTDQAVDALYPLLISAAERGAVIDILWGHDDIGTATNTSRAAAERLRARVANAGRADSIRVHPFSTNSHTKIAVADNGRERWHALVGSCNWLSSNFGSFEASLRLREPRLVGLLTCKLAGLTRGRPGIWHDLAIQMTVLGRSIESTSRGNGRTVPMRLLFAPDHAKLPLEARDRAHKRIFVLSHRFGIAAQPVSLLPILAAVKVKQIEASAFFGRTTGPLSGSEGADLTREFGAQGLRIRAVHRPRIHAKVLGWDDDALAISSLNWLSADPPDLAPFREIGVLVEAPQIAEHFLRVFEQARVD
jgi:phospholipase D-like protein